MLYHDGRRSSASQPFVTATRDVLPSNVICTLAYTRCCAIVMLAVFLFDHRTFLRLSSYRRFLSDTPSPHFISSHLKAAKYDFALVGEFFVSFILAPSFFWHNLPLSLPPDNLHHLFCSSFSQISGLVFSGSLSTALSIVGSDFVTKSGFMFAGERLWNKVDLGCQAKPEIGRCPYIRRVGRLSPSHGKAVSHAYFLKQERFLLFG